MNKNLVLAAKNYVRWHYEIEARRLKRLIRELKKKERVNSKGIKVLPKGVKKEIEKPNAQLEEVLNKISQYSS